MRKDAASHPDLPVRPPPVDLLLLVVVLLVLQPVLQDVGEGGRRLRGAGRQGGEGRAGGGLQEGRREHQGKERRHSYLKNKKKVCFAIFLYSKMDVVDFEKKKEEEGEKSVYLLIFLRASLLPRATSLRWQRTGKI